MKNDKPTYEQLHLKVCKQILHTSKRASNLGVRSDLGRLPLMFNIICAVCKYRIRLESYGEDDLLYHALKSQQKKSQNSYNTMTYDTLANKLLNTLGMPIIPVYDTHNTKDEINKIFKPIKIKCKTFYTSSIFESEMHHLKQNCDSKLAIYSHIKTNYNKAIRDGKYLALPHSSAWQPAPH